MHKYERSLLSGMTMAFLGYLVAIASVPFIGAFVFGGAVNLFWVVLGLGGWMILRALCRARGAARERRALTRMSFHVAMARAKHLKKA